MTQQTTLTEAEIVAIRARWGCDQMDEELDRHMEGATVTQQTTPPLPEDPTLTMLVAGKQALLKVCEDPEFAHVYAVWEAMLAAWKICPQPDPAQERHT